MLRRLGHLVTNERNLNIAMSRRQEKTIAILLMLPLLGFLAWLFWPRPFDLRPYELAIKEIQAAPERILEFEKKHRCKIETKPHLRVAFIYGDGLLDNWVGIVYDPTAEVLKAREFKPDWSNWNDPALSDVKKLFGGDLRSAEPLGGPWSRCGFT